MTDSTKTVLGDLHVANSVFADLAGYVALECYGIVGMVAPDIKDGIIKLLPHSRLRRGVVVSTDVEGVSFDLYVVIEQGLNLTTVSENLESRLRYVMSEYAEAPVKDVTIHVQGFRVNE